MKLPATTQHPISRINHGTRPRTLGVVVHTIEGSAESAMNWFDNPEAGGVGSQVVVGTKKCYQLSDLNALVWHAAGANTNYIGFEHDGFSSWPRWRWLLRRTQRKMSANRTAWICYHYGLGLPRKGVNVFGHVDFPAGGHDDPGKGWPWDLYMAACRRAYRNLVKSNGKKWTS